MNTRSSRQDEGGSWSSVRQRLASFREGASRRLRRLARWALALVEFLIPHVALVRVRRTLRADAPDWSAKRERFQKLASDHPVLLDDPAQKLWEAELVRLRRLEDKLAAQLTLLTPLIPFAVLAGGAALGKGAYVALGSVTFGGLQLLAAYFMAASASQGFPLATLSPADLDEFVETDQFKARLTATVLANIEHNQARGIDLNNRIHVSQRSIAWGVVALGLAGADLVRHLL